MLYSIENASRSDPIRSPDQTSIGVVLPSIAIVTPSEET